MVKRNLVNKEWKVIKEMTTYIVSGENRATSGHGSNNGDIQEDKERWTKRGGVCTDLCSDVSTTSTETIHIVCI